MKILGAGFPRTGTLSTRGALTDLGLDPCIHGDSFVNFSTCQLIKGGFVIVYRRVGNIETGNIETTIGNIETTLEILKPLFGCEFSLEILKPFFRRIFV